MDTQTVVDERETTAVLCPDPAAGCPGEVEDRWVCGSTDGPVEMAKVRCTRGCWYVVEATRLVQADYASRRQE